MPETRVELQLGSAPRADVGSSAAARGAYRLCHTGGEELFDDLDSACRELNQRPGARLFKVERH